MSAVYVKQAVVHPDALVALQEQLSQSTIEFPIAAKSLHLTLFHYGSPEGLYQEIVQMNPNLDWDTFFELFQLVLMYASEQEKKRIKVRGEVVSMFEDSGAFFIILKIQKTEELMGMRFALLVKFHHFLSACGIDNVDKFMLNSPTLQYHLNYPFTPHITLGVNTQSVSIPDIDVDNLEVLLDQQEIVSEIIP